MSVAYILPLERSIGRAKRLLLQPFRLETWLVLGFAAFLVRLTDSLSGLQYVFQLSPRRDSEETIDRIAEALAEPFWLLVAGALIVLALVLLVLFTWISSRAKFVLLDGVLKERAEISEPWSRYARLGDSLFLWRLAFGISALVGTALLVAPFFFVVVATGAAGAERFSLGTVLLLVPLVTAWAIALAYTAFFLEFFVVPIMHRRGVSAARGWGLFLPLLRANFLKFLLCGLFVLVLSFGVLVLVLVAGCVTCCCGFLLMAIPYVGSVVLLPVTVSYRAYGPEFLAQFGPEWSSFEPEASAAEPPPVPEPPSPLT